MERAKQLELAGDKKEEGTQHFKAGQIEDARRCYTQVLDLVADATAWTGQEKKTRDELIHVAHLNLAACELKLANNAKVIQHCNLALETNNASVKAYYRRAKAYQNCKDFALALKDYQRMTVLEPQNKIAREELSRCHKLQESHKEKELYSRMFQLTLDKNTPAGNAVAEKSEKTLDVDQCQTEEENEEYHEVVVTIEYETDPSQGFTQCQKNPGHIDFIPVKTFKLEHLPAAYQDEDLFELISIQIGLAVRVRVRGSSPNRPLTFPGTKKPYPFSGRKCRKMIRTGSGWANSVSWNHEEGEDCPCGTCKTSNQPAKKWGRINIFTASHVVFDSFEGSKTTCHFFYDTDDTDPNSCPVITGATEVISHLEADYCLMTFATHDLDLVTSLRQQWRRYHDLCSAVKIKYHIHSDEEDNLIEKFSNLYKKNCQSLIILHRWKDTLEHLLSDDICQQCQFHLEQTRTGHNKSYRYLLSSELGNVLALSESCQKNQSRIVELQAECQTCNMTDVNTRKTMAIYYKACCDSQDVISKQMIRLKRLFTDTSDYDKLDESAKDKPRFKSQHPFTVIVSHPHGGSKKITLGEIQKIKGSMTKSYGAYTYSNATCPGSSSARGFILGRLGTWLDLPHSRLSSGNALTPQQINKSAVSPDV